MTHGIQRRSELNTRVSELAGWQLLMPGDGCFTGLTAAELRGWPMPNVPADLPVFMAMGKHDPRPMRAGVRTSRHTSPVAFEVLPSGLRCATGEETILALARVLGPLDLVPMIDHGLHSQELDPEILQGLACSRRPGARSLAAALPWVDAGAESWWESMLRMMHVACGAVVESQVDLYDAHGTWIARADLLIVGTQSLAEYDGEHHRDVAQHADDLRRDRRLHGSDYIRRGYVAADLLRRPVEVLRDIDRALGRDHDPARLRPWLELLAGSLFTESGLKAFRRRVGRTTPRSRAD